MSLPPRIKDLDLVFTYARSSDDRSTNLLFTSLQHSPEVFQATEISTIVNDPLYQKIMGSNSIVYPYESTPYPVLLATTEILENVAVRMEQAKHGEAAFVCREGSPLEHIDLHDTYYSCQLPQKLILGCAECVNSPSLAKGCAVRQAAAQCWTLDFNGIDPDDVADFLYSRKTKIGNFVYISPVLTTHEHFTKAKRTIDEHDFSFVEERAAIREKIIASRTRLNAVKKNICTHCCVQKECLSEFDYGYTRYRIRQCDGRYPETEEEAANAVLNRYPPAMSFEQMSILMANSGELDKRYNRCISYATFTHDRDNAYPMAFGIVSRRGRRRAHLCKDYEEAISILREYNGYIREPHATMTPRQYALLMEAINHRHSPQSRSRWHSTKYPRLFVSSTYSGGVEVHYTYNSHSQQVLPWTLEANNLGVFVQHYYDLKTLRRIHFSEEELKQKRGRKSGKLP